MKKILLSMLFAGTAMFANAQKSEIQAAEDKWIEYANSQNAVVQDSKLDELASKMKVSADKIKKSNEAPKAKPTLAADLAILNAGLAHTDLAIAHEKTKDEAAAWGWRAMFASRIALIDTSSIQNSIEKEKIAVEAIAKTKEFDKKDKEKQHIDDAIDYVDNAVANRGMLAFRKKDYAMAYDAFSQMTIKNPNDTSMYVNAGLSANLAKKYPEAVGSYRKAIDMGYKDSYPLYSQMINITASELKDSVKYLSLLNEAAAKFPDSTSFIGRITDYYMKKGDIVKSQEMLGKLIEKEPNNAVYHYLLGDTYFKQALTAQDKRQTIDQKDKKAYDDMSVKMMALIDQSLPHYKKALELDPKYGDAVDKLKSIYGFKSDTPNYEAMDKLLKSIEGQ